MIKKDIFDTFIFCLCFWSAAGMFGVEVKSVTEGDSVTLKPDFTEVLRAEEMKWKFNGILIAQINRQDDTSKVHDSSADGRFRDRLKVDHQTGFLIITNTTINHSGLYTVYSGSRTPFHTFNLIVYTHLPVPVISRDSEQSSFSVSNCSFLCSVVNVNHVTLSWLKGNSLFSSISVSDLNNSISLHLECLDDSYSCVVKNPIGNQTSHMNNTELCQPCAEHIYCCGSTEAVIRLVLSCLVGVATIAVLVYDIRSRSYWQKRSPQTSTSVNN